MHYSSRRRGKVFSHLLLHIVTLTIGLSQVISLGGWFVPWILPPRDLIRLVPGQLIATQVEHFCQGYTLSDTACASLQVEVEAFVNDGPGIFSIGSDRKHPIYIPVHYPSTAPRVTIVAVDVDADMSINVTIGVGVDVQWASQRLCVSYYRDHVSACNVSSIEAQIKESLDRGTGDEESRIPQWQLVTPLVSLDVELLDHDRGSNGDRSSMARVLLFDRNGAAGPNRAAAAFCAQHLCQDRINTVRQVAASLKTEVAKARGSHFSVTDATDESVGQNDGVRLVVSLSSLPRRLDHLAPILRRFLSVQTRLPSALYVALPRRSLRERRPYPALPAGWPFHDTGPDSGESKFQNGSAPIVRVLHVDTDWYCTVTSILTLLMFACFCVINQCSQGGLYNISTNLFLCPVFLEGKDVDMSPILEASFHETSFFRYTDQKVIFSHISDVHQGSSHEADPSLSRGNGAGDHHSNHR
jgi:hypothetical protein